MLPEFLRIIEQVPKKSVGIAAEDGLVPRNCRMVEELMERATTAAPASTIAR